MNKGLKLIAGVFLVFFITFGFSVSSMAEGWMLICGVADYKYINDLTYTDNDARGVYNLFVNVYGKKGAKKHAKLFIDKKAKKKNIKKQFKKMAKKAKPGDVFGFYFSGHGGYCADVEPMDEADGYDEYICPYNNLLDSTKNSIRDDELEEYLNRQAKIEIEIETKKHKSSKMFSVYLAYPTRGMNVSFNYEKTGLKNVREVSFFAGRHPYPEIRMDEGKVDRIEHRRG